MYESVLGCFVSSKSGLLRIGREMGCMTTEDYLLDAAYLLHSAFSAFIFIFRHKSDLQANGSHKTATGGCVAAIPSSRCSSHRVDWSFRLFGSIMSCFVSFGRLLSVLRFLAIKSAYIFGIEVEFCLASSCLFPNLSFLS